MNNELEEMVRENNRQIHGAPEKDIRGLRPRMFALETWQIEVEKERLTIKALLVGLALGAGLNLAGIIAIFTRLGGF